MRFAIDIDSTLHPYWDQLAEIAKRRYGVDLPYDTPVHVGDRRARARAAEDDRRRDPQPGARAQRRAVPRRGRGHHALARAGPLHPHHEPPGDGHARPHGRVAGADRPPARRPVLLLRQDHPLRGAPDRRAHRRLAGQPAARRRSGYHRGDARAPVEPGRCRTSSPPPTGRRWPAAWSRTCREGTRTPARPSRVPARHRAGAPGHRLGSLRARRGLLRPDDLRLPLPLLVPGRGRRHRARPDDRRRAAGLQPLRRAPARRVDDREGDQGRAPRPARCT